MLDDQVLSRVTGTVHRGTERVSTAHCLDLLGVGQTLLEAPLRSCRMICRPSWNV